MRTSADLPGATWDVFVKEVSRANFFQTQGGSIFSASDIPATSVAIASALVTPYPYVRLVTDAGSPIDSTLSERDLYGDIQLEHSHLYSG